MPFSHSMVPSLRHVRTPVGTAVLLALAGPALAQQPTTTLGEVVVTAQKRSENLQDVPISLSSLNTEALQQLNVQNFKDYVRFLPTVSFQPSVIGSGAGFNLVYMRGIATGGDGQAILSQPSVGMYLDEQPITTVQGNLDVHLYDIARVEALAGPQGTLYGASSQAGTIRIITNQPDPSGFAAGYSLEGNYVDAEEPGYVAEGFVNLPIGDQAAIRLVGWVTSAAGWIDNVPATRLYAGDPLNPDDNFLADNAQFVEDNYNTVDTIGARAQLGINLGDNWTLTPSLMYQKTEQEGTWGDDLSDFVPGNQAVAHFREEFTDDEWYQAGLTIEGSIGNFDVVYSGNYIDREVDSAFDYSDYSYFYNVNLTYFNSFFVDNDGNQLDPSAAFAATDQYNRTSHELRISTPDDKRVRGLLGFFYQKQEHDFYQEYGRIVGLADTRSLNEFEPTSQRFPGVVYLNSLDREDTDQAVFGQVAFDLTDKLELSLGARYFEPEVTARGFFGFPLGFVEPFAPTDPGDPGNPANGGEGAFSPTGLDWASDGERQCPSQADVGDKPCINVDKGISEHDWVGRVNLSWKATDTAMLYATWSEGYRPGGIQRNPFAGDYESDFLTNYELGWKTRFADDRLQFNGAVFLEQWDDIQIGFAGDNGITQVDNGPNAEVKGLEAQLDWVATDSLRLGAALAYYDSELKDDYVNFDVGGNVDSVNAPAGTPLPVTPELKLNLIARYTFPLGGFEAHVQGAATYEDSRASNLNLEYNSIQGDIPSSNFLDLAFGVQNDKYGIELFVANATDEDADAFRAGQCNPATCGGQSYGMRPRPRTFGIRFKQDF